MFLDGIGPRGEHSMPRFEYETEPLDELEDVLGVFYGGHGQVGQQFVVTNRRLLMGPLDTGIALEIDAYILNKAVGGSGDLIKSVLNHYAPMSAKTLWLRHVVNVAPTNNAQFFKAPGLRVTTDTDQAIDIHIVATVTTRSGDPINNDFRDKAIDVIRNASAAAKGARPAL